MDLNLGAVEAAKNDLLESSSLYQIPKEERQLNNSSKFWGWMNTEIMLQAIIKTNKQSKHSLEEVQKAKVEIGCTWTYKQFGLVN